MLLSNRLCLNSAKTQLIWFGTRQQINSTFTIDQQVSFLYAIYSSSVRDFCAILDSSLRLPFLITFQLDSLLLCSSEATESHMKINHLCRSTVFATIVRAFICFRIDYCNSLLKGLPKSRLSTLQSVLNAAARLLARLLRFTHISIYMTEVLHWYQLPLALN